MTLADHDHANPGRSGLQCLALAGTGWHWLALAGVSSVGTVPGPRQLLRRPAFRRLYAARLTSQLADGIFQASLINFVVFNPQKAPDAGGIASSLVAVLLPFTLVGPFAGIALDRLSRQRVLVFGALARAAGCLAVAALMAAGHRGPDLFTASIAVLSISRFVLAALSAAMPVTLDDPHSEVLVPAGALSTTSGAVLALVGAALGTGLRSIVGDSDRDLAAVAIAASIAYVAAGLTASRSARAELGPRDPAPFAGAVQEARLVVAEVVDGATHLWQARAARNSMFAVCAHRLCYGLSFVTTVLLYRSYFTTAGSSGNLSGLGTIVGVAGAGTFVAAVLTPRAVRRWGRPRWITWTLLSAGFAEATCGPPFREDLFLVASFVIGFAAQAIKLSCDSLVQETIEDAYRGRAFSFYDLALNVFYLLAAGIGAVILPANGKSYLVVGLLTVIYTGSGLAYGALSGSFRRGGAVPVEGSATR
jgi:MFS family permease